MHKNLPINEVCYIRHFENHSIFTLKKNLTISLVHPVANEKHEP